MKNSNEQKKVLAINSLDARHGSTYRMRALVELVRNAEYAVEYSEGKGSKLSRLFNAILLALGDYDVLFTQRYNPVTIAALVVATLRRKPTVVDWDDLDAAMHHSALKSAVAQACEWMGPHFSSRITTHSVVIEELLRKRNHASSLIYQGFDAHLFNLSKEQRLNARKEWRARWDLSNSHFVVGHMCTFTPGGTIDLDIILEAVSKNRDENTRLLLIGGGRLQRRIENKLRELNIDSITRITGLLPHETIPSVLAALDLSLVFMTDNAANRARVSFKVLESLAAEVPVLGKLVGASHSLFGELIHSTERNHFAGAILNAARNPLCPPPRNAVARFSWKENQTRMNDVLEYTLLAKSKRIM